MFIFNKKETKKKKIDIIFLILMFIISYSMPLCLSYALNHWAFLLFLLKVRNETNALSLTARLGREASLKVLY